MLAGVACLARRGAAIAAGLSDGRAVRSEFVKLCYPLHWHYDILLGLKVMAEAGFNRV